MNKEAITIATITLARNTQEERELRLALQELASLHMPVIVADGGSTPSFLSFLHSLPHFTVVPVANSSVWAQAKASVEAACHTNTPFVFYTEPDKKEFFKTGLLSLIAAAGADESTGIVLASRSAAGFATFPFFQQMTESAINHCCAEVTGTEGDYCYGPFLLNRALIPYLDLVEENIGWGWRPYCFGMAHRLGYTTDTFEAGFTCPSHQREDDEKERIYRMKQLEQNIRGLVLSTNVVIRH